MVTSVLFKLFGISNIWSQITGTLLGTIITAIVTVSLLSVQTDKEISHDRDVGIFEKKQEVYHNFIEALESITQDGKINIPSKDNPDKNDELQHLIYQLGFVQMHASHILAEDITQSIGDLLSTVSLMQNETDIKKNELYSQFAENVFHIVSLLKQDLYKERGQVDKEKFKSALCASGAFDDELLSENGRSKSLKEFLEHLKSIFEEKDYKTSIWWYNNKENRENNDIKSVAQAYINCKSWINFKIYTNNVIFCITFPPISEGGGIWLRFYNDEEQKNYNAELTEKYKKLPSPDLAMNFLNTNDLGYKTFARLSENGKKSFVQKYASNIDSKIQSLFKPEVNE